MPDLMPFCANTKCVLHYHMVEKNEYTARIATGLEYQEVNRHMYVNRSGHKFELCSICHEAINMLNA